MKCVQTFPVLNKTFGDFDIPWMDIALDPAVLRSTCREAKVLASVHLPPEKKRSNLECFEKPTELDAINFAFSLKNAMQLLDNKENGGSKETTSEFNFKESIASQTPSDTGSPSSEYSYKESTTTSKSCLRQLSTDSTGSVKRKVSFADDCGEELTTVKVTEPSDAPAEISETVIQRHLKAAKEFAAAHCSPFMSADEDSEDELEVETKKESKQFSWKLGFEQPASDFCKFHERFENDKVALENVILRSDKLIGTIKVANISFEKSVFVRLTFNNWKRYHDYPAFFQTSNSHLCDTFTFEIDIPMHDENIEKIEFSVLFLSEKEEHWDSNDGKNYSIIPKIDTTSITLNQRKGGMYSFDREIRSIQEE